MTYRMSNARKAGAQKIRKYVKDIHRNYYKVKDIQRLRKTIHRLNYRNT